MSKMREYQHTPDPFDPLREKTLLDGVEGLLLSSADSGRKYIPSSISSLSMPVCVRVLVCMEFESLVKCVGRGTTIAGGSE